MSEHGNYGNLSNKKAVLFGDVEHTGQILQTDDVATIKGIGTLVQNYMEVRQQILNCQEK